MIHFAIDTVLVYSAIISLSSLAPSLSSPPELCSMSCLRLGTPTAAALPGPRPRPLAATMRDFFATLAFPAFVPVLCLLGDMTIGVSDAEANRRERAGLAFGVASSSSSSSSSLSFCPSSSLDKAEADALEAWLPGNLSFPCTLSRRA